MHSPFPNPRILLCTNVPKALHGLAPRVVKGQDWWDGVRRKAYRVHEYQCWACGTRPELNRDLHAHEVYEYDWEACSARMTSVTALCRDCHSFIHSGRMQALVSKGQMSEDEMSLLLQRGYLLVKAAGLVEERVQIHRDIRRIMQGSSGTRTMREWEDETWDLWHLIIDGESRHSLFADYEAWRSHYASL
tara:strand:- start:667 stop:1236 length:570 start_codon:yes stop_codon:yes gene_type:complete